MDKKREKNPSFCEISLIISFLHPFCLVLLFYQPDEFSVLTWVPHKLPGHLSLSSKLPLQKKPFPHCPSGPHALNTVLHDFLTPSTDLNQGNNSPCSQLFYFKNHINVFLSRGNWCGNLRSPWRAMTTCS